MKHQVLTVVVMLALYGCGGSGFAAAIPEDGDGGLPETNTQADSGAVGQPEAATDAGVDSQTEADSGNPIEADAGMAAEAASPKMCCDILGTAVVQCDPNAPWFCVESGQSYSCTQAGKCMTETMCSVPAVAQSGVVQACP